MAVARGSAAMAKNQVVSAVTPTTLRQTCIIGTCVRNDTPRTRVMK
ncbi:hypothetical protein Y695_03328 [Hydrogenophaga sp. T4]|nr:hypothetical protein Y695_03328 [Hydrogenophaga sp. T4]